MPITIITDPGIDDIVALLLLSKLSNSNHTIVSTFGNSSLKNTFSNSQNFLQLTELPWNHKKGISESDNYKEPHYYKNKGVSGVLPKSIKKNIQLNEINDYSLNNDVISIANFADLVNITSTYEPENITIMAGSFKDHKKEANINFDIESANKFFVRKIKSNISLIPFEICEKVFWDYNQVNSIPVSSEINIWIKRMILQYLSSTNTNKFTLYDPLAVFLHFFTDKCSWRKAGVQVGLEGENRGRTILVEGENFNIATDIKMAESISTKIFKILFNS